MSDAESARRLLQRWSSWWHKSGAAPERLPNALQVRTALALLTSDDGNPIDLLREWLAWWATDNSAPPEMPDALNVRTSSFLAKWALVELQETGAVPPLVGVCPLCYVVVTRLDDSQGAYCARCRAAHGRTVIPIESVMEIST